MLNQYDKLFFLGHFCLMRNNEKMNRLFLANYKNMLNFEYTRHTNYICHFDENGTIAYAAENDDTVRYYGAWPFYDVPCGIYKMMQDDKEVYAVWENGKLCLDTTDETESQEIMYIHLQKRTMRGAQLPFDSRILVLRDEFLPEANDAAIKPPVDAEKERAFLDGQKERRKAELVRNLKNGALKFRLFRLLRRWKAR